MNDRGQPSTRPGRPELKIPYRRGWFPAPGAAGHCPHLDRDLSRPGYPLPRAGAASTRLRLHIAAALETLVEIADHRGHQHVDFAIEGMIGGPHDTLLHDDALLRL